MLDDENFEAQCANPQCKLIFWCNPQNPSGRMWTEEELARVAQIVEKYNLWIISDEIHCDLIRCGKKHIPMAKVMKDYPKLITCMAPSKTFNLAGLAFSNIIIRDPGLRARFKDRDKLFGMVNPMSLTAAKAAYDKGGSWLEGGNALFVGNAAGYIRLNLAMPRSVIRTGLERIRDAVRAYRG